MPRGIYDRKKETETNVVVEEQGKIVPRETISVPKADLPRQRQYSTNKDHKGEGEPLCLNCGHRSDMHYIEHRWTEEKIGRNLQGDIGTIEVTKRRQIYDGARPCQHACLCKQYE